ncbi:hypothetical protein OU798_04790 [Prolixibacteraceae bacterium Z1-6]|uniref:Lipoprotein n=1 Tax=Draconibacterium aestuarii TaxID=2998507 RepID=A0A9X3FB38_9BACT|nr:hypothetical protein [Prolixibacteraceae bacterium Z1-6]
MKVRYLKILFIGAVLCLACTTKVSEWVLLNETPENYVLVYFHKRALTAEEIQQNAKLEQELDGANVVFKTMERREIEKPYYALLYNNRIVSDFENYKALQDLAVSPIRNKIASELKGGKLCVLLYLKSGNNKKDEVGLETINNTLKSSLFGNIISVVELNRNSVDESLLVSMLLSIESDLKEIHEPMLFGVFGCFRALEPLLAKGISEGNINLMLDFLTADCSCLIKDNLPGRNMLYSGKWEDSQPALVNAIIDSNPQLLHH